MQHQKSVPISSQLDFICKALSNRNGLQNKTLAKNIQIWKTGKCRRNSVKYKSNITDKDQISSRVSLDRQCAVKYNFASVNPNTCILTIMSQQTVQTLTAPEEQSDQGLHCLPVFQFNIISQFWSPLHRSSYWLSKFFHLICKVLLRNSLEQFWNYTNVIPEHISQNSSGTALD